MDFFQQQLVNPCLGLIANDLVLWVFYELPAALIAPMILFAVVNEAVFNNVFRVTIGAGRQRRRYDETLDIYSFIIAES